MKKETKNQKPSTPSPIGEKAEQALLAYSRRVLWATCCDESLPEMEIPDELKDSLNKKRGGFVTLKGKDGTLRGCIGIIEPTYDTLQMVKKMTISSAQSDPRFSPVRESEVDKLLIEISLLEEPLLLDSLDDIIIGRDGLIVEKGNRRGLLLPQVASERNWDKATFFNQTLLKAGLSPQRENFQTVKTYFFCGYHFGERK